MLAAMNGNRDVSLFLMQRRANLDLVNKVRMYMFVSIQCQKCYITENVTPPSLMISIFGIFLIQICCIFVRLCQQNELNDTKLQYNNI